MRARFGRRIGFARFRLRFRADNPILALASAQGQNIAQISSVQHIARHESAGSRRFRVRAMTAAMLSGSFASMSQDDHLRLKKQVQTGPTFPAS